ncbi:hypothetical protein LTR15_004116 [Elasticomyces elasticus]|nr:hypothetical protein LTR15_004116 [Elasticomyces elasticus]
MLLAAGAIALKRHISDQRAQKKEAKQGLLLQGDSDLAKRAFAKTLQNGTASIQRSSTNIKFEDPDSLGNSSPTTISGSVIGSPTSGISSPVPRDIVSPAQSGKAMLAIAAPDNRPRSRSGTGPPPYSPGRDTLAPETPSSMYPQDWDSRTLSTSDSSSFVSRDEHALKIRTKGSDLKSGFVYHPALFDLKVRPDRWDQFTQQVIETTKLSTGDTAKVWSAATASSLTGFVGTPFMLGRAMKRSLQEQSVKASLKDTTTSGLGHTLNHWNETYFQERGLFVYLELSDSAKKKEEGGGSTFRKPTLMYSTREERDRKREDRKYIIVITRLDQDDQPADALGAISEMPAEVPNGTAELPAAEDAKYHIAELPAGETVMPVEMPAMETYLPSAYSLGYGSEKLEPPVGYAELDSDTTHLLEKTPLSDEKDSSLFAEPTTNTTPYPANVHTLEMPYKT